MKILAIESSCDETSAAVTQKGKILSNIISSQIFHKKFGGVVPELASRAHVKAISTITQEALAAANTKMNEIDAIAVTSEPGLVGALITGSNFAKGLSLRYGLPIIPINHIEGHIYSGNIDDADVEFPYISLVVSGGHTAIFDVRSYKHYEIIGLTRDDAAGEAFDKIAKLIGLPYPGGPHIDELAKKGNPRAFDFPRPMIHENNYDFSFSGLKTSVRYFIAKRFAEGLPEELLPDVAASVQSAIVDVLVSKTIRAAKDRASNAIVIGGGVSANSELRRRMTEEAAALGIRCITPTMAYCMDNAAMIGFLAEKKLLTEDINSYYDLTYRVSPSALRAAR